MCQKEGLERLRVSEAIFMIFLRGNWESNMRENPSINSTLALSILLLAVKRMAIFVSFRKDSSVLTVTRNIIWAQPPCLIGMYTS